MRKFFAVAACAMGVWMFGACGSSNSGGGASDPVGLCKEVKGTLCDKIFNCFTKAELDLLKDSFGLNATDCRDKLQPPCTPDQSNCDSGETFHADKAQACADGVKTLSCNDIKMDTIPTPAACDLVCTK
ncbi:MAG: hypothetical protein ABW133_17745 [Polyangiaceae bacterium]